MSFELPWGWKLGTQLEADRMQNEQGERHHTELLESLALSHQIVDKLDGIGETYYIYDFADRRWNNFLNAALQLEVAMDLRLTLG